MNRRELIDMIREKSEGRLSKDDQALISMLENEAFPDISIERYLEVKADYRRELHSKGIVIK